MLFLVYMCVRPKYHTTPHHTQHNTSQYITTHCTLHTQYTTHTKHTTNNTHTHTGRPEERDIDSVIWEVEGPEVTVADAAAVAASASS